MVSISFTKRTVSGAFLVALLVGLAAQTAQAQRPFRIYDPFYQGETARRTFFDGYALTAEVYTRQSGMLQQNSVAADGEAATRTVSAESDPIGLSFLLDYQLFPQFDVGAVLDASGNGAGRRITLSWVTLKYSQRLERANYALRLAVDPSADGRMGFPQIDGAFLYTSALSRRLSYDFALGARRVRMGFYEQRIMQAPEEGNTLPEAAADTSSTLVSIFQRALGWELHAMMSYRLRLDQAGSNLFVSLFGDLASYEMFEAGRDNSPVPAAPSAAPSEGASTSGRQSDSEEQAVSSWTPAQRSGVIWLRTGLTYSRPSYRAAPFLAVPLRQWMPDEENWRRARLHVGLRLMLR